jgi:hypothetical protein
MRIILASSIIRLVTPYQKRGLEKPTGLVTESWQSFIVDLSQGPRGSIHNGAGAAQLNNSLRDEYLEIVLQVAAPPKTPPFGAVPIGT